MLSPECCCDGQGINANSFPPITLKACAVQLAMMKGTERDHEFIADLLREPASLREGEVVSVGRLPAADKARLDTDRSKMGFIADPAFSADEKRALINSSSTGDFRGGKGALRLINFP